MPDGLTHSRVTIAASIALPVILAYNHADLSVIVSATAGCLSGLIISPDLDVDSGFYGLYIIRRATGGTLAFVWQVFWWPYSRIVPHRSFWSHSYIFGTLIRLCYLLLPILAIMWLVKIPLPSPTWEMFWFVAGLSISDGLHITMDKLTEIIFR